MVGVNDKGLPINRELSKTSSGGDNFWGVIVLVERLSEGALIMRLWDNGDEFFRYLTGTRVSEGSEWNRVLFSRKNVEVSIITPWAVAISVRNKRQKTTNKLFIKSGSL